MLEYRRTGADAASASLIQEAEVLRTRTVPGVAALKKFEQDTGGEVRVVTSLPPGVPLPERLPVTPPEAAGICLAIIAILSDLSATRVAQGRLVADDVHLTDAGQPVLRALPGARLLYGPGEADHTGAAEHGLPVVRDLGDLLARMLPAPSRSRWRLGPGDPASTLRLVALRATDPAVGLTQLAQLIRAACPEACLPTDLRSSDAEPRRRRHALPRPGWSRRRVGALAAVALVAAASVAAAVVVGAEGPTTRGAAGVPTSEVEGQTDQAEGSPEPAAPRATAVWPRPQCPPVVPPLRDDGEGCPVELRATDLEVSAGGRRWRVGGPGDYRLAVGDWDCTGRPTTVVLDVVAGTVWLFSHLPTDGQPRPATMVGHATGAVALVPPPGGCGAFSARDSAGAVVAVVVAGTAAAAGETAGNDSDADGSTEEQG